MSPEFMFRSADGIEEETGIPAVAVEAVLESSPIARKSVLTDREGRTLYASIDQPKTFRERAEIIRLVLARHPSALSYW
jgi:hypothetical protein